MRAFEPLDDGEISRAIGEAGEVLARIGVEFHGDEALAVLGDHGACVDRAGRRACLPTAMVERAIEHAPARVPLYDVLGTRTHDIGGDRTYFAPGSAAMRVLDPETERLRPPTTADYVRYVQVASGLPHLAAQSTAFIPADVHERISDSYRLYLSLFFGRKPVVTGTFTPHGLPVMLDLMLAVRGTPDRLRSSPLAMFTCCPTSPLKWSADACRTLVDCARAGVPVEIVPMPLAGFTAPVTLRGLVVQHAAEVLSGLILHQLAGRGAPALYGGSSAIFDIRHETTPMGAIETMMRACACAQMGRALGLPTQAYIALSDAKRLDAQAGAETAMGAALAALARVNQVSGPGMLDMESGFSLEKLVLDDQICGMALQMRRAREAEEEGSIVPIVEELLRDGHVLIADHTRRHLKHEIAWPSAVIDRLPLARWEAAGGTSLPARAAAEIARLVAAYQPPGLDPYVERELTARMQAEARRVGMERLPELPCAA
jgi:trimethylamine--corrinoid protein Co-methyltransferase